MRILTFFVKPFSIAIILSIVSAILLLPLPTEKMQFFPAGYQKGGEKVTFRSNAEIIPIPIIKVFLSSINFPSQLKYYNAYFKIRQTNTENEHLFSFYILIRKSEDFSVHATKEVFGEPDPLMSGEDYNTYSLEVSDDYVVPTIPITVPVSFSTMIFCDSTPEEECPIIGHSDYEKIINFYAKPNIWSWFIQFFLIFAFWVVIIHRRWRKS